MKKVLVVRGKTFALEWKGNYQEYAEKVPRIMMALSIAKPYWAIAGSLVFR